MHWKLLCCDMLGQRRNNVINSNSYYRGYRSTSRATALHPTDSCFESFGDSARTNAQRRGWRNWKLASSSASHANSMNIRVRFSLTFARRLGLREKRDAPAGCLRRVPPGRSSDRQTLRVRTWLQFPHFFFFSISLFTTAPSCEKSSQSRFTPIRWHLDHSLGTPCVHIARLLHSRLIALLVMENI